MTRLISRMFRNAKHFCARLTAFDLNATAETLPIPVRATHDRHR
ncbi:MAG: hypothetical protein AAFQ39_06495 [Pseudomonadota bacterium]